MAVVCKQTTAEPPRTPLDQRGAAETQNRDCRSCARNTTWRSGHHRWSPRRTGNRRRCLCTGPVRGANQARGQGLERQPTQGRGSSTRSRWLCRRRSSIGLLPAESSSSCVYPFSHKEYRVRIPCGVDSGTIVRNMEVRIRRKEIFRRLIPWTRHLARNVAPAREPGEGLSRAAAICLETTATP